jgi:carbohydrate-selective porin OprB
MFATAARAADQPNPAAPTTQLGVGQGRLSHNEQDRSHETIFEAYYNIAVKPWLKITPDVQYIMNPADAPSNNAVVIGVRMQIVF